MKVWVDPEKCRGHALCLMHASEAFEFIDLEDRSVVIDGAADSVAFAVFQAAANECPERAIMIEMEG